MSSSKKVEYSCLLANHLDSQSRLMPMRIPTALTLCPIVLSDPPLLSCLHDADDVGVSPNHRGSRTFGPRSEALDPDAIRDLDLGDVERIFAHAEVVDGVSRGALHDLFDGKGSDFVEAREDA